MFRAGLVEEMGRKEWKPLGNSIIRAVKASGQSCNILSIMMKWYYKVPTDLLTNQTY